MEKEQNIISEEVLPNSSLNSNKILNQPQRMEPDNIADEEGQNNQEQSQEKLEPVSNSLEISNSSWTIKLQSPEAIDYLCQLAFDVKNSMLNDSNKSPPNYSG